MVSCSDKSMPTASVVLQCSNNLRSSSSVPHASQHVADRQFPRLLCSTAAEDGDCTGLLYVCSRSAA
jgi:hypothetical protein